MAGTSDWRAAAAAAGTGVRHLIIGGNCLMNQLMAFALRREVGGDCATVGDPGVPLSIFPVPAGQTMLVLADDSDANARSTLLRFLAGRHGAESAAIEPALFNVDPGTADLPDLLRRGVRGIFLRTDPLERLVQGIRTLLKHEPWIPAAIFSMAPEARVVENGNAIRRSQLSLRELQVLSLVGTGSTNEQIAHELCLSRFTVKTHVYNIFKKLDVGSRLQAALWAMEHLGAHLPGMSARARIDPTDGPFEPVAS